MRIEHGNQVFTLKDREPLAQTILGMLRASGQTAASGSSPRFEKHDFNQFWNQLSDDARRLLGEIAKRPVDTGMGHGELRALLNMSSEKFRGVFNGIARLSVRLQLQKPVRSAGYNEKTRIFRMEAETAAAVRKAITAQKPKAK